MPRRASVEEVLSMLTSNEHAQIIGIREDTRLEFKLQLNLSLAQEKHKLARAAAAMANTSGGLIVVGIGTEKDIQSRVDFAAKLAYVDTVDMDTYHNVLSSYLYPRIRIAVEVYGLRPNLLVGIRVEQAVAERPVLVTHTTSDVLNGGTVFGYYARTEEGVQPMSYSEIHSLLQVGERLTNLGDLGSHLDLMNTRLSMIERHLRTDKEDNNDDQ